jgi:hypothetical protein
VIHLGDQWYSNKELFEQMLSMKEDIQSLRTEMRETREIIRRYNGLREELYKVKDKVEDIEARSQGKNAVLEAIRNWGGWLFALITLIVLLINQIK